MVLHHCLHRHRLHWTTLTFFHTATSHISWTHFSLTFLFSHTGTTRLPTYCHFLTCVVVLFIFLHWVYICTPGSHMHLSALSGHLTFDFVLHWFWFCTPHAHLHIPLFLCSSFSLKFLLHFSCLTFTVLLYILFAILFLFLFPATHSFSVLPLFVLLCTHMYTPTVCAIFSSGSSCSGLPRLRLVLVCISHTSLWTLFSFSLVFQTTHRTKFWFSSYFTHLSFSHKLILRSSSTVHIFFVSSFYIISALPLVSASSWTP